MLTRRKKTQKIIKGSFIFTFSILLFAFIYFKYEKNKLLNELAYFESLALADQAFFIEDFDEAFENYNQLNTEFFSDSLYQLRKNFRDCYVYLIDSKKTIKNQPRTPKTTQLFTKNNFINPETLSLRLEAESKNEMIEFIANCKSDETLESLSEKSDKELVKMLKECYKKTQTQKIDYQNKLQDTASLSYLKINGDREIHFFGELKDGLAYGSGVGVWEDQCFYEGEWKNNMRHGKGKFTTEKGEIYDGEYEHNKRNGIGLYIFRNGDYYTGEWKDNKRSGLGTVISAKGDTLVHGYWENDRYDRKRTKKELNK